MANQTSLELRSLVKQDGTLELSLAQVSVPSPTADEVVEFNRRTVVMADSLVFAPKESELAVETTRRYGHCSAGMALDFLDAGSEALHVARFRPVMRPDRYNAPQN